VRALSCALGTIINQDGHSVCVSFYRVAAEYGLYEVYKREFHEVFQDHEKDPEFGQLMVRMKVVDENGESSMDEDQWEAASECRFRSFLRVPRGLTQWGVPR
jgi:hypothetical protein